MSWWRSSGVGGNKVWQLAYVMKLISWSIFKSMIKYQNKMPISLNCNKILATARKCYECCLKFCVKNIQWMIHGASTNINLKCWCQWRDGCVLWEPNCKVYLQFVSLYLPRDALQRALLMGMYGWSVARYACSPPSCCLSQYWERLWGSGKPFLLSSCSTPDDCPWISVSLSRSPWMSVRVGCDAHLKLMWLLL